MIESGEVKTVQAPPAQGTKIVGKSASMGGPPVQESSPGTIQVSIPGTKVSMLGGTGAIIGAFLATLASTEGIDSLARLIAAFKSCTP